MCVCVCVWGGGAFAQNVSLKTFSEREREIQAALRDAVSNVLCRAEGVF